jgi:Arc/MetJ family transcription regulator
VHGTNAAWRGRIASASFDEDSDALVRFGQNPRPQMRTTVVIDDRQLASARELSGIKETTAIVREALQALIERESSRRLARLGGTEPGLAPVPRRTTSAG